MQLLALTTELTGHLTGHMTGLAVQLVGVLAADEVPEPEDVKAGWIAFTIWILLIVAVALLGWGLTKQLRRTEANRKAGAFGPVDDEEDTSPPSTPPAGRD